MARTKTRITPPVDFTPLGRAFAQLRKAVGLLQSEVAFKVGISASQIGRIEVGKNLDRLSFEDVIRLCRFYNLSPTRAAEIMGLWPVPEVANLESDQRVKTSLAFMAHLPPEKRDMLIDIMLAAARALDKQDKSNAI